MNEKSKLVRLFLAVGRTLCWLGFHRWEREWEEDDLDLSETKGCRWCGGFILRYYSDRKMKRKGLTLGEENE